MNELTRRTATYVAKNDDSLGKEVGKSALAVGAGGLALWGVAGLLPFVNLPMLLVAAVVLGVYLWLR